MSVGEPPFQREITALYSEHHGWLLAWLRRKLGCRQNAADLAQDTFVRLLQRTERLELKAPRAFLRTIARGLVIDHWRREEIERAYLETIPHLPEAETPSAAAPIRPAVKIRGICMVALHGRVKAPLTVRKRRRGAPGSLSALRRRPA